MDEVACMWNKAYRSLVVYDVKESLRNDIGNQILNIRKENQLTQEEFGKLFHVTRQTVSNWENGKSYPAYFHQIHLQELRQLSLES